MDACVNCGLNDFIEQDGMFYCSECNTRKEGAQVQLFEETFAAEGQTTQWLVRSQVQAEPVDEVGNVKILTSWETFNICLKGLVSQLTALGATPKFEAMVFKLWVEYLQRTEAAFFSHKKLPPKLPKNAWETDAYVVYNIHKTNMSVEEIIGKKSKGNKRKISDTTVTEANKSDIEDEPAAKTSRQIGNVKRKFFKDTYDKSQISTSSNLDDTTHISSLTYKPEESSIAPDVPSQIITKTDNREMVPLRRKHLLAFIYLGMLMSQQDIHLSDLLRWIDEGHIKYHHLNSFFMPDMAVLTDLKEYFMNKKTTPRYVDISRLTRSLARFLHIRNIPPPDVNGLVHKFCNEFNLPNQVALVSRRLVQLLPIRVQDPEVFSTITSWETRAMAQIIVSLKLLLGLDDASEHRNSRIAAQIKEVLRQGGSTIDPFIWDEWVRWNALRSIALLLHGKTPGTHDTNTGLYQNVHALVSVWESFVPSSEKAVEGKRRKMESELMSDVIGSLNYDSGSYEDDKSRYPATTTPYQHYTEAVLSELENGLVRDNDDAWNALVRNIDLQFLRTDFRPKSIEYLLHPERYIEWAQQKGLPIGLRNGGAFRKSCKSAALSSYDTSFRANVKRQVTLTKKSSKKKEEELQLAGSKSVVLPAATKPDETGGRPLEPLQDLTDAVPSVRLKVEDPAAPPPQPMPPAEQVDQYLHVPSTEYFNHSKRGKDAPISFRHLIGIAARYLHTSKAALLDEVKIVEDVHKNFLDYCSGKIAEDDPVFAVLKK